MTRKPIEELVVGAARGEPMDVDERERLAEALQNAPHQRQNLEAQEALTADLAALREALRVPPAPPGDEERLREAFRAARARRRPLRRNRRLWAAASVAAAAATLVVAFSREGWPPGGTPGPAVDAPPIVERRVQLSAPGSAREASSGTTLRASARGTTLPVEDSDSAAPAVFYALPFAPGFSVSGSYSVVRVRIPLASFAAGAAGGVAASVEADVLIGDDGIPSAIRFADAGTLFVSSSTQ